MYNFYKKMEEIYSPIQTLSFQQFSDLLRKDKATDEEFDFIKATLKQVIYNMEEIELDENNCDYLEVIKWMFTKTYINMKELNSCDIKAIVMFFNDAFEESFRNLRETKFNDWEEVMKSKDPENILKYLKKVYSMVKDLLEASKERSEVEDNIEKGFKCPSLGSHF